MRPVRPMYTYEAWAMSFSDALLNKFRHAMATINSEVFASQWRKYDVMHYRSRLAYRV